MSGDLSDNPGKLLRSLNETVIIICSHPVAPVGIRWAVSDSMMGVWELKDNPCLGRDADKTFYAQSTYVLPIEGMQDQFIAMFDRWNKTDLINSRYVWLPIEFDGDRPLIRWADQWSTQTMEAVY